MKRLLVGAMVAAMAVAGLAGAQPAYAATVTISGTVSCEYGHNVVGVWVQSSGGSSGFAGWSAQPGRAWAAYYSKTIGTGTVSLHVGCGNNSSSWWGDNWTPNIGVGGSATLNTSCWEAAGTATRCAWPSRGGTHPTNTFYAGYCTWGAAVKWREATGAYPGWNGDAKDWDTNARNNGWSVTTTPRARSVVVMEYPGATSSTAGHVGWVNSYRYQGGTIMLNLTDMNSHGFNTWSNYERAFTPGAMEFIMAP